MIGITPRYVSDYERDRKIEWQVAARASMLDTASPHLVRIISHEIHGEDPRPTTWERLLGDDFGEVTK